MEQVVTVTLSTDEAGRPDLRVKSDLAAHAVEMILSSALTVVRRKLDSVAVSVAVGGELVKLLNESARAVADAELAESIAKAHSAVKR